jgi:hypothetical protein
MGTNADSGLFGRTAVGKLDSGAFTDSVVLGRVIGTALPLAALGTAAGLGEVFPAGVQELPSLPGSRFFSIFTSIETAGVACELSPAMGALIGDGTAGESAEKYTPQ